MSLPVKCLKYLVLIYNVLFCISGFAVFILSSIYLYKILTLRHFTGVYVAGPTITLLVIGFLTCLLSWVGWRSAWYLHRWLVIMFGILLALVVVTELGISIWSIVIWDTMKDDVTKSVDLDFQKVIVDKDESSIKRWEKIQSEFYCCGVGGPSDYRTSKTIPWSCCRGSQSAALTHIGDCGEIYQPGCLNSVYNKVREEILLTSVTALCAALLQSTGLFCVFLLVGKLGRGRRISESSPFRSPTEDYTVPAGLRNNDGLLETMSNSRY